MKASFLNLFLVGLYVSFPGFCLPYLYGEDKAIKRDLSSFVINDKHVGEGLSSSVTFEKDWEEEFAYIEKDIQRFSEGKFNSERLENEVLRKESLFSSEEKSPLDVIYKRTRALTDFLLKKAPGNEKLKDLSGQIQDWKEGAKTINRDDRAACLTEFKKLCRLRRDVSFQNPLLNFDKMVFMTHYSQRYGRGEVHIVDQYLGFNQKSGGAMYMLENPFSDQATARSLFKDTPLANGPDKGKPLKDGSYMSLELGYNADKLYFAWTQADYSIPDEKTDWSRQNWTFAENRVRPPQYHHYFWERDRVFHLYSADLKTGELKQLTDGITNDYDPCELPNGRIVFISERAQGNQRCGDRWLSAGTLHSMLNDGTDIYALSVHETNEWHPSVTNDGMIAYTRWDYVDRDDCQAHHLWTCYPDGSDPRSKHGNYSLIRANRPHAEVSIRAIPDSRKFVAVASAHHGISQGSLVLIDQNIPDDGAMSQVKRITPEAHFPESEYDPGFAGINQGGTGCEYYGTPWPLSEDFHICIFSRDQRHMGIYLVDSFGNRELLWKDKEVPCLDPIPLRVRPKPPVIPERTKQSLASRDGGAEPVRNDGEFVVLNVYDSEYPLPEGTKIKWLRVVNIFSKTTPFKDNPMIGATESLTRGSLGIVPVEEDGSAYFKAPSGVNLYFQLLDENKRAIQTMRSATYLHPGERLSCIGCHENKFDAPKNNKHLVAALKRKPSEFTHEPKGAYPVAFPRLVQPVLDKHCVSCHAEKGKFPLDGNNFVEVKKADGMSERRGVRHGWSNGYSHLFDYSWYRVGANGVYAHYKQEPWSTPGQVGAKASKLFAHLDKGHQNVKLSPEDFYRITLWLDLNSNFYGDYARTEEQLKGKLVWPKYGVPVKLPDYIANQDKD